MARAAGKAAKRNSAFMKPMQPSEQLAKVVGAEPLPRSEVTKKIWAHIKKHKLQNPQNKREILADDGPLSASAAKCCSNTAGGCPLLTKTSTADKTSEGKLI